MGCSGVESGGGGGGGGAFFIVLNSITEIYILLKTFVK